MIIDKFVEEEIYNKIDLSIDLSSYLIDADKLYLNSCNFKWIELSNLIFINDAEYKVEKSDKLEYEYMVLNYNGTNPIDVKLKNFYFYEGTPIDVTQVFSQKSNLTREKLPMMWLSFMPLPVISGSLGSTSPYPNSIRMTLYFAGLTDYGNRHTAQHMRMVVSHLDEYVEAVVKAVDGNRSIFAREFTYRKRQLPIFGRTDKDGFRSNILDQTNLSAIELELDVQTSVKCKC